MRAPARSRPGPGRSVVQVEDRAWSQGRYSACRSNSVQESSGGARASRRQVLRGTGSHDSHRRRAADLVFRRFWRLGHVQQDLADLLHNQPKEVLDRRWPQVFQPIGAPSFSSTTLSTSWRSRGREVGGRNIAEAIASGDCPLTLASPPAAVVAPRRRSIRPGGPSVVSPVMNRDSSGGGRAPRPTESPYRCQPFLGARPHDAASRAPTIGEGVASSGARPVAGGKRGGRADNWR